MDRQDALGFDRGERLIQPVAVCDRRPGLLLGLLPRDLRFDQLADPRTGDRTGEQVATDDPLDFGRWVEPVPDVALDVFECLLLDVHQRTPPRPNL